MKSFVPIDLVGLLTLLIATEAQQCPTSLTCNPIADTAIKLDGKLDEWANVIGLQTDITQALTGAVYGGGQATYKCLHSDTQLYLGLAIPGNYRFNDTVSEMCAAIATLFQIGSQATLYNMGGCPEVLATPDVCSNGTIPASCESHRVGTCQLVVMFVEPPQHILNIHLHLLQITFCPKTLVHIGSSSRHSKA